MRYRLLNDYILLIIIKQKNYSELLLIYFAINFEFIFYYSVKKNNDLILSDQTVRSKIVP